MALLLLFREFMADLEETSLSASHFGHHSNTSITDNAVPLLPNEAHFDVAVQPQPTLQNRISQLLRSQYFRVFVGLVMLFVLLWTFCIVAAVHPIYITNWTSQYVVWSKPKTVNYIATPIATVFAITTTYYFGQCVRFAMRKYLAQRLEARAFLGWSALANKRVVLRERSRWTTFTLLSAVLLAALTTGFTANFTPQQLLRSQRQSPFGELDMSSSAFLNIYTPISQSSPCRYGDYTFFFCSKSRQPRPLMLLEAGESAALNYLGYFATTNFAETAFMGPSGGVMPLGSYPFAVWFADNSSQPTYDLPSFNSNFTSYNVSYQQQGLTADVTCRMENSSPLDYTTTQSFSNFSSSIITPTITCGNASTVRLAQQVVGADFLLASSCSLPNQTQYMYLRGYGAYGTNTTDGVPLIANMTCQLNPIFTTNTLTFVGDLNNNVIVSPIPNSSFPAVPNSNTTLISDITTAVTQSLLDGQSQNGNAFVDFILGLVDAYPGQVPLNYTLEAMFQSMFEIAGLSVNGYWSSKLFANGPPAGPFSRPVSGDLTYTLYGWNGDVRAIAGLIPFTVAFIIALCMLIWSNRGTSYLNYDPSEPLNLMVASGAGDFGWMSDVNIEMDDIASLSTGFIYKKVDGRWTLTGLSQPLVDKQG